LRRRGEEDRATLTNYGFLVKKKIYQKNQAEKKFFRVVEETATQVPLV
jgi:hypothetical protein